MENPIKLDDLGVPLFSETSISVTSLVVPHTGSVDLPHANPEEQPLLKRFVTSEIAALPIFAMETGWCFQPLWKNIRQIGPFPQFSG